MWYLTRWVCRIIYHNTFIVISVLQKCCLCNAKKLDGLSLSLSLSLPSLYRRGSDFLLLQYSFPQQEWAYLDHSSAVSIHEHLIPNVFQEGSVPGWWRDRSGNVHSTWLSLCPFCLSLRCCPDVTKAPLSSGFCLSGSRRQLCKHTDKIRQVHCAWEQKPWWGDNGASLEVWEALT